MNIRNWKEKRYEIEFGDKNDVLVKIKLSADDIQNILQSVGENDCAEIILETCGSSFTVSEIVKKEVGTWK